jgi:rhodanese-related sulfurtransferase
MFQLNPILRVRTVTLHEFKSIVLNNLHNEIMAKRGGTVSNNNNLNKSKHVLIDVRELNELRSYGHVPFALHVPLQELPDVLLDAAQYARDQNKNGTTNSDDSDNIPEHDVQDDDPVVEIGAPGDKQLIFFCGHGVRSQYALSIAESCGFREHCCAHFPGGFSEYNQDPVTKEEVDQFVREKEGKGGKQ